MFHKARLTRRRINLHDDGMRGVFWAGIVAVFATACSTTPNKAVCCTSSDDCASIGVNNEPERTCPDGLVCVAHGCTPPTACEVDTQCPLETPHCSAEGTCVECVQSDQCSSPAPVCAPDQTCVECLQSDQCPIDKPVCGSGHTCQLCVNDDDCASGVCDTSTGACLAEATIVYASPTGPNTTVCTKIDPCSITSAFAAADLNRETIKLAPGTYVANVAVADKKVVVHGSGATLTSSTSPTLLATNRVRLRVIGLTIVSTASPTGTGVEITNGVDIPFVELDQVTVDTTGKPVNLPGQSNLTITRSHLHARGNSVEIGASDSSSVTVDRTLIDGGGDGIGAFNGAIVHVTNSVIAGQTSTNGNVGINGAVIISYSSIVNSAIGCGIGTGSAVCSGASPDGMCIDNSIIFNTSGPVNTITSTKCTINHSLIFRQSASVMGANNMLGVDPLLVSAATGDFHLQAASPAIDAADPVAVDAIDFDGTSRPQGARNDLGAFERGP